MKTRRICASAQLVPGKDDDLITWLKQQPAKGRNQALKAALRNGLGLPLPKEMAAADIDALRRDIESMRGAVANIPRLLENVSMVRGGGLDTERINMLEEDIQTCFNGVTMEMQGLRATLDALIAGGIPGRTGSTSAVEEGPRLDEAALTIRKTKLKKASW